MAPVLVPDDGAGVGLAVVVVLAFTLVAEAVGRLVSVTKPPHLERRSYQ